jgi:hypothetical protein
VRFEIPPTLLARLRAHRAQHSFRVDPVTEREDAFILDPGMGPVAYLTRDGRVLLDGGGLWDELPVHEANDDEAVTFIVVGARKTGIVELMDLLPPPAPQSHPCPTCAGTRWQSITPEIETICTGCAGRGWLLPSPG